MRRERSTPRPGWRQIIAKQGMCFDTPALGADERRRPYWDESVHYVFDMDGVLAIEASVEVLHSMCLDAVEQVVLTERYRDFGLPEWSWPHIEKSWRRSDPHLYGRFDLRYDGRRPPVLLEYNADTPTSLLEASILQWYWKTDVFPERRPVELAARETGGAVEGNPGSVARQRNPLHVVVRGHQR
ncbi:hypothetical protein MAUB1S_05155 [Mycolicibacterium aubagnense]